MTYALRRTRRAIEEVWTPYLLSGGYRHGDIIGWDRSNRAYILTHAVSGVDWTHYKHLLPEHVYDIYMRFWKEVTFHV